MTEYVTEVYSGIILRRYLMANILRRIFDGRCVTAGTLWQIYYARYITADILRQVYYGRYMNAHIDIYLYTHIRADILWQI